MSSGVSFSLGGALPLAAAIVTPSSARVPVVAGLALILLAGAGALGGRFGGAPIARAAGRVLAGGGAAMLITWLVGALVGTAV